MVHSNTLIYIVLISVDTSNKEVTRLQTQISELRDQLQFQRDETARKSKLISNLKATRDQEAIILEQLRNDNKSNDENIKRYLLSLLIMILVL